MEALWDPGSQALLDELGIGPGWKCLEVGAGGGSLVEWMADRGAHVTAIDINTRFVDHLASDSITVRRIDIRDDELPQSEFDLVHPRLVLEHLSGRRHVLDRLAATLRPGGWIVIEDYDWSTRVRRRWSRIWRRRGSDPAVTWPTPDSRGTTDVG